MSIIACRPNSLRRAHTGNPVFTVLFYLSPVSAYSSPTPSRLQSKPDNFNQTLGQDTALATLARYDRRSYTLLIVEPDPFVAAAVEREVRTWREVCHTFLARSFIEGNQIASVFKPDIIVTELPQGHIDDGITGFLRHIMSHKWTVVLTKFLNDQTMYNFIKWRMHALVTKNDHALVDLRLAIYHVIQGKRFFTSEAERAIVRFREDSSAFSKILSDKEIALLRFLGCGLADREIGKRMHLAPGTVHSHRQRIMRKLQLHRREELMLWCLAKGFVCIEEVLTQRQAG